MKKEINIAYDPLIKNKDYLEHNPEVIRILKKAKYPKEMDDTDFDEVLSMAEKILPNSLVLTGEYFEGYFIILFSIALKSSKHKPFAHLFFNKADGTFDTSSLEEKLNFN